MLVLDAVNLSRIKYMFKTNKNQTLYKVKLPADFAFDNQCFAKHLFLLIEIKLFLFQEYLCVFTFPETDLF